MKATSFVPLPEDESIQIVWPTPNHYLFDAPEKFFARTRVNADYGKPGFTRDCGKRFHRGCDIAPVSVSTTGQSMRVVFTDCATGRDFESEEPVFVPHDPVYAVWDGVVAERVNDENVSDFGKHLVLEHRWPKSGAKFFTLYGHLAEISFSTPVVEVSSAFPMGLMGQTSRIADARNWMMVAPHLHFEVRDADGKSYDPLEFLRRFLVR